MVQTESVILRAAVGPPFSAVSSGKSAYTDIRLQPHQRDVFPV